MMIIRNNTVKNAKLQQCLPFTVLKPHSHDVDLWNSFICCNSAYRLRYWNFFKIIATLRCFPKLQQCLPFTVLKLSTFRKNIWNIRMNSCNSAYRLRYWNLLQLKFCRLRCLLQLQQCLPFTVLKLSFFSALGCFLLSGCNSAYRLRYWNGESRYSKVAMQQLQQCLPFTVLKLTIKLWCGYYWNLLRLQQCLPFAVLKPTLFVIWSVYTTSLQQCLPLAVLKPIVRLWLLLCIIQTVATVLTACGIETQRLIRFQT